MNRLAAAAAGLALAGALSGCGNYGAVSLPSDGGGGSSAADDGHVVSIGWHTVDEPFAAPALPDGADLPGNGKPVLINLWASFCGPCKAELPRLQQFSQTGDVAVLGVSADVNPAKVAPTLAAAGVTYPDVVDVDYLTALGSVVPPGYPSSVLVVNGKVVAAHPGPFRDDADLDAIDGLVRRAG